ncbi:MAG TPA: ABC-F family ATP-binding cassette domain-containing protein [Bacillota bacterium]|nr:ABC-F family ATP-binding cassette domain-containing protein [Bacillota bacterium]
MNIIRLNDIEKTFGGTLLFKHVSFEVNDDDKVAVIGKNGVGKTTLFKIMLGAISPDSGEIFISRQARIGYLSQDVLEPGERTLFGEMLLLYQELENLGQNLDQAAKALATDHSDKAMERYSRLETEFQIKGGYQYKTDIETMLTRFGFSREDHDRFVSGFSGGEKTRIAFAKLLLMHPDILLLDEPTNHMDIEIIEWLEDYLKKYQGAVVVVTHDQYFINKVTHIIYELDQETMNRYTGTYEEYEAEKMKRYELLMKQYVRQQKEIAHLQSYVDRFRYKANKASQAQDRIKKIAKIDRIDKPTKSEREISFAFRTPRPTDAIILEAKNLTIGYNKPLIENISFQMRGRDKIGIIGQNGAGKTTLVKTLLGTISALKGNIAFPKQLKIGYFDQMATENRMKGKLIDIVHDIYPQKNLLEVRKILARFQFVGEDVFKETEMLSGGEMVRLRLLLLLLEAPEFLVLDEPTNHLDISTKDIVEDVFAEYDGPIVFISHDRYFINKVATRIIEFDETKWQLYEGNYDFYKESKGNNIPTAEKKEKKPRTVDPEKEIRKLESSLEENSVRISVLQKSLFQPEIYMDKSKYTETETEIKLLETTTINIMKRIEELSS